MSTPLWCHVSIMVVYIPIATRIYLLCSSLHMFSSHLSEAHYRCVSTHEEGRNNKASAALIDTNTCNAILYNLLFSPEKQNVLISGCCISFIGALGHSVRWHTALLCYGSIILTSYRVCDCILTLWCTMCWGDCTLKLTRALGNVLQALLNS